MFQQKRVRVFFETYTCFSSIPSFYILCYLQILFLPLKLITI